MSCSYKFIRSTRPSQPPHNLFRIPKASEKKAFNCHGLHVLAPSAFAGLKYQFDSDLLWNLLPFPYSANNRHDWASGWRMSSIPSKIDLSEQQSDV
jgi:hypothetical protein